MIHLALWTRPNLSLPVTQSSWIITEIQDTPLGIFHHPPFETLFSGYFIQYSANVCTYRWHVGNGKWVTKQPTTYSTLAVLKCYMLLDSHWFIHLIQLIESLFVKWDLLSSKLHMSYCQHQKYHSKPFTCFWKYLLYNQTFRDTQYQVDLQLTCTYWVTNM